MFVSLPPEMRNGAKWLNGWFESLESCLVKPLLSLRSYNQLINQLFEYRLAFPKLVGHPAWTDIDQPTLFGPPVQSHRLVPGVRRYPQLAARVRSFTSRFIHGYRVLAHACITVA